jgi:hypothetical protein
MKPTILATADRLPVDWSVQPRVMRFERREQAPQADAGPSGSMLMLSWLLVALVPVIGGRVVAMTLDEPLLGIIAGVMTLIPLMMAFCPRCGDRARH